MKLRRVELHGVRGLPDGIFEMTDPRNGEAHRLVLVTGPTASGKTRFLEAILAAKEQIAPYAGPPMASPWIRAGGEAARVAMTFELSESERTYGALEQPTAVAEAIFRHAGGILPEDDGIVAVLRRYEHGDETGKFEYFPALRFIPTNGVGIGLSAFEQRTIRASNEARKHACVVRIVYEMATGGPMAERFAEHLARLSPTIRFQRATVNDAFPRCFRRAGDDEARSLKELSSGEVDAVIFAAVAALIGLGSSIVLVDTPEIHADPEAVPALVQGLLQLGPDVQVIAATRSPALLRAAQPGQVVDLGKVTR